MIMVDQGRYLPDPGGRGQNGEGCGADEGGDQAGSVSWHINMDTDVSVVAS